MNEIGYMIFKYWKGMVQNGRKKKKSEKRIKVKDFS